MSPIKKILYNENQFSKKGVIIPNSCAQNKEANIYKESGVSMSKILGYSTRTKTPKWSGKQNKAKPDITRGRNKEIHSYVGESMSPCTH